MCNIDLIILLCINEKNISDFECFIACQPIKLLLLFIFAHTHVSEYPVKSVTKNLAKPTGIQIILS